MKLEINFLFILIIIFFVIGCSKGNLPEYSQLGSLRVLSLKADQPEVAPGTQVMITPFISDLDGNGRTLTYQAIGCEDPGLERGVDPNCDSASDKTVLDSGTITTTNSPSFTSPNYTGSVTSFSFTVPSTILTNKSEIYQNNGVYYVVTYNLTASDGTTLKTLKRITVSNQTQKNTNPSFQSIQSSGTALTSLPTAKTAISATYPSTSKESYSLMRTDGSTSTLTETLIVSWFISDGSLDYIRTIEDHTNNFTPPTVTPTAHQTLLIGVLRDGRGGEDIQKIEF